MRPNRMLVLGAALLLLGGGLGRGGEPADDAQKLVARFEREADEIRAKADKEIQDRRAKLLMSLKELADNYAITGRADAAAAVQDLIQSVKNKALNAKPDPGNLAAYNGRNGESFYFEVTGNAAAGQVWGTDLYTDDSTLAAAAVHAGVLKDGQKGVVKVTIQPGADSYKGTTRNGVATEDFGRWNGSYRVEAVKK